MLPFLIQIVLYHQRFEDCDTFRSLMLAAREFGGTLSWSISIWDNSPESVKPDLPEPFVLTFWHHDAVNSGLVSAYNTAAKLAASLNLSWVLLLDQDTRITGEYIRSLIQHTQGTHEDVVGIVPRIVCDGHQRSPVGHMFEIPAATRVHVKLGISDSLIFAVNSGMLVQAGFLNSIGGYSERYSLDAVDHWFCREAYRHNKRLLVLPDSFEHALSVYDRKNYISHKRYRRILAAQSLFAREAQSATTVIFYGLCLMFHALAQFARRPGTGYAAIALGECVRYCLSSIRNVDDERKAPNVTKRICDGDAK